MKWTEQHRLATLRRLMAEYSVLGRDGLAHMRPGEVLMLAAELQLEVSFVSRTLREHPHDELCMLKKSKLERELTDVRTWMNEQKDKDGPDMEM